MKLVVNEDVDELSEKAPWADKKYKDDEIIAHPLAETENQAVIFQVNSRLCEKTSRKDEVYSICKSNTDGPRKMPTPSDNTESTCAKCN